MTRPPKYKTETERLEAQRAQKAASEAKRRRAARGLDPLAPHAGEVGTGAKTTPGKVREIRRLYKEHNFTIKTLAYQFDLSESAIREIVKNESWKFTE